MVLLLQPTKTMTAPTLKRIKTADGFMWEIAYAGMIRQHSQSWQAIIYYHQAMSCYQSDAGSLSALLHGPDPTNHVESTSSTAPSDLSGDYAPSSMEQD